ncbi:uncharacterized protein LOC129772973 [Toxorhynchites rutilus septentrionalis]|uniref:uncharacterized protein LOC129772973 n=1 Tax=Toxorhynchites rutilus septentrionalis TaxID=329112 RepID=UPI002479B6FE|nr:uncharacterized protein LOC129772973 [Toxorhynchites rutilus septentrionalis]
MSAERRIKGLKSRYKSLKSSLIQIKIFVDEYQEDRDYLEVPVRLEHLQKLWTDLDSVQSDLEMQDDDALDELLKERMAFESLFYKAKGFLLAMNKQPTTSIASLASHSHHLPAQSSHIRLPDVRLPTFSGNIDTWLNFHDLFVSLVHSSADLSSIQKFYYLRSSLAGDALKLVQTVPISAENYPIAWELLINHYQNTARLKRTYVDALFDFPSLKRESATELHSMVEKFESNVKILKQLGERTEYWDIILIRMLSIRLDPTTRRDWEEHSSALDNVSFQELTTFIKRRVTVLQTINMKAPEIPPPATSKRPTQRPVVSNNAFQQSTNSGRNCAVCLDHHPVYLCPAFSKLDLEGKEKHVRRLQLCRNCLRKGHPVRDCPSSSSCRRCRGRHHTQLCSGESVVAVHSRATESEHARSVPTPAAEHQTPKSCISASLNYTPNCAPSESRHKNVLLATAIVTLVDANGAAHLARALLDSGSEYCFVTESFSQSIKAPRQKISLPISGIGQSSTYARYKIVSTIRSRTSEYSATVELVVLPKVTIDLPSSSIDPSAWKIPPGIQLADPTFYRSHPIDLILGAEIFFDLFTVDGRIQLGDSSPFLVNSVLGWVLSGKISNGTPTTPIVSNVANVTTVTELQHQMERFWTIEEGNPSSCYSLEETACENHFRQTVARNLDGRYIVRLPLQSNVLEQLGDNRSNAIRRFRMLESRLNRQHDIADQYTDFMNEYQSLGHMRRVTEYQTPPENCYHLPHHAVIREESTTTKLRVVFDASAKTSNGPSLNDALLVGPIVQEDLRSIIMRSRRNKVMLIADIKQMFRQILVDPRDTPLQRIVWRSTPDAPLDTFELQTVTYGTASAPFLATRVLQQLADDEQNNFPKAAEVLRKDFYVDDLFSGANSIEEAIELREQLEALLSRGGFQLRKWASNEQAVLEGVAEDNLALKPTVELDDGQCIKTLGLHWEPANDILLYRIQILTDSTPLTKRIALSQIARLFDPLGLVGPVVTFAKVFMQTLWTLLTDEGKSWGWDDQLPSMFVSRWGLYLSELPRLNELRIERYILCSNPTLTQLHFFSDASKQAYGACCYVRSIDSTGAIKVALLTSKSKVAPLKQQSIPRLELCGALLSAQLYQKVTSSLQLPAEAYFWVDSTTVLCWLQSTPSTWTTFVANRVSKIQLSTEHCNWNHVTGLDNPADCLSRGCSAESLLENDIWWNGPRWLRLDEAAWPARRTNNVSNSEEIQEVIKTTAVASRVVTEPSFIDEIVEKFSSYTRLVRVVAYCHRFLLNRVHNYKLTINTNNQTSEINPLSRDEIRNAEAALIRLVQQQEFPDEWKRLQQSQPVRPKSRLRWFAPFMSPERLIRIGGRLAHASQPYDSKHQILLPGSHPLSALLVRSLHLKQLHAAPQLLLTILRLRYWITGARSLAKVVVHQCIICFKARPKLVEQFMGELPAARVTANRPFSTTGVDYWGPITLQPPYRRAAPSKAYIAVFVCFSTRAVHIELVTDLSTAKFIQALRRFVSRRGLCAEIYSDNGRNFLGADNEIQRLVRNQQHRQAVAQECASNGIVWHFNPPKASHFGGLWEAAIRSAQKHFTRALGTHRLAFDEMLTLLAQIECCLNSRPIVPISDDPSDMEPLTPGHFLVGSALKAVPDSDVSEIPLNRSKPRNYCRTSGKGGTPNICRHFKREQSGAVLQSQSARVSSFF